MKKTVQLLIIVLTAIALLLGMSTLTAAAGETNTTPAAAAVVDSQTHSIPANSSLWYRFEYAGDGSLINLALRNATNSGLQFNVWTPQQVLNRTGQIPVGRGTAQHISCVSGAPRANSACSSNDLTWSSNFNSTAGTYYVEVVNNTASPQSFSLSVQGSGVSLGTGTTTRSQPSNQGGAAVPAPAAVTTPTPAGIAGNTDAAHALNIDNKPHRIPANSSRWFRFDYAGDGSLITLTLRNATYSGVKFNIWTPSQVLNLTDQIPVGRGTAQHISCVSGAPRANSPCSSLDLTWVSSFTNGGTYYVEIVNTNSSLVTTQLLIEGSGVTLKQQ